MASYPPQKITSCIFCIAGICDIKVSFTGLNSPNAIAHFSKGITFPNEIKAVALILAKHQKKNEKLSIDFLQNNEVNKESLVGETKEQYQARLKEAMERPF
jgi:hypothetical protein